ncbi:MAG: hypothetical protein QM680_04400 [Luteolibacter sp.]
MKIKPEQPFFDAWLTRTRKQLSASGQLSQMAFILAKQTEFSEEKWRQILRELIDGKFPPSWEILSLLEKNMPRVDSWKIAENQQLPFDF